jgi:phosphatidylserine/phosphatidylglycerophosphate/cardiolipin synthase-like enzyme
MFAPRRLLGLGLCATLFLLAGCSPLTPSENDIATCDPGPPPASEVDGLYVLPDDGRDPVLHEIDRARCTIDVTTYLISDDTIIDALVRAEDRGVRVRLIHEATPFGGGVGLVETAEEMEDAGVEVRTGPDRFRFVHAKYLVIDGRVAIVTNQNLTYSAFESNREFGVITTNRQDVATLAAIFDADWNDTPPPVASGRLIVSPQNARQRLLELIDGAETSIDLYAEVIRDDEIIDALSTAAQRGVRVRIIVNAPEDALDATVGDVLASNGVELRVAGRLYIHAKAMVLDGEAVVIGSTNPTSTSLDRNREVSLLVEDPAAVARVEAVFARDWTEGAPWEVGAVGGKNGFGRIQGLHLTCTWCTVIVYVQSRGDCRGSPASRIRRPSCGAKAPDDSAPAGADGETVHVAGR